MSSSRGVSVQRVVENAEFSLKIETEPCSVGVQLMQSSGIYFYLNQQSAYYATLEQLPQRKTLHPLRLVVFAVGSDIEYGKIQKNNPNNPHPHHHPRNRVHNLQSRRDPSLIHSDY